MQRWGLLEVQGVTRGEINEKLNYSQFLDYFDKIKQAYDECKITKHSLDMVLKKFEDFKLVSNFSIVDKLLKEYYLMIHTNIIKITITEWKECPITELIQHYNYYKYMSKLKNDN